MPRAIVSAGHTSREKGAEANGLVEYDLTRKIADFVIEELRGAGILTLGVPPDMDLASRIEWINNTGYNEENDDIAVEIHINDGGLTGIEGWYKDKGENKSFYLTKSIVDRICSDLDLKYQGVKSEYEHPLKKLAFVHYLEPVPALVECLYIDNETDAEFLKDENNLKKLAKSIANGIQDYWKEKKGHNVSQQDDQGNTDSISQNSATNNGSLNSDNTLSPNQVGIQTNQLSSLPGGPPTNAGQNISSTGSRAGLGTNAGMQMGNASSGVGVGTALAAGAAVGAGIANQVGSGNAGMNTPSYATGALQGQQISQPISFEERERRRLFIEDLYTKALGRKPTFQETTYFVNNWDGEVQLTLRMLDSQDHADILQKAIDYEKVIKELKEKDNIISRLKVEIRDKDGIIKNLNRLVVEKNMTINELRAGTQDVEKRSSNANRSNHGTSNPSLYEESDDNSFMERLKKFWADII